MTQQPRRGSRRVRRVRRAPALSLTLALTLALAVGACSGGGDDAEKRRPAASGAPAAVATRATLGTLTGRLPAAQRQRLVADVAKVVDGWWEAAYLGGDYPRTDFAAAWPGFTPAARDRARRDAALTSNRALGSAVDSVTAQTKRVRLDVLAVERHAVGVTARVALRFTTTGDQAGTHTVAGRVYLTPTASGWRIFGYDLRRSRS